MTFINSGQAASLILHGQPVVLTTDNRFIVGDWKEKVRRFLSADYKQAQIQAIVQLVAQKLTEEPAEAAPCKELWSAIVRRYGSNSRPGNIQDIVRVAEKHICQKNSDIPFKVKENQNALAKWVRNGHDEAIFRNFPEDAAFLFDSNLLSQMKVSRDKIEVRDRMEINCTLSEERDASDAASQPSKSVQVVFIRSLRDGKPCILVEGEWMPISEVRNRFEYQYSPKYQEIFVLHRQTKEVYTYLDNRKGLQKHHPFLNTTLTPVSALSDEEYRKVHEVASRFHREGAEPRPFVLQVVSSRVKGPDTNLNNFMVNAKHPYIRIIAGEDNRELGTRKGDVYEIGFGWKRKPLLPFAPSAGQFRSPDTWEYMPCQEKIVTNIPLSQEEVDRVMRFTRKYHNEGINLGKEVGFHLGRQNCSAYVRNALQTAGVNAPTQIGLSALVSKICPGWIKQGLDLGYRSLDAVEGKITHILPSSISDPAIKMRNSLRSCVKKVIETAAAFILNPLRFILGEGIGKGGEAFDRDAAPSLNPFSVKNYQLNLPGVLQEWQREQPSTQVFRSPMKLAIEKSMKPSN